MRYIALFLLVALAVACQTTASTPTPAPAAFTIPDDPSVAVITLDRDAGSEAMPSARRGPTLEVYADGRVVVREPWGAQTPDNPDPDHVAEIEGKVTREQVQELAAFIATPAFFGADSDAVRQEMFRKHGEIADAGTVSVSLKGAAKSHTFHAYALSSYQPKASSAVLDHMSAVEKRLEALRAEIADKHPRKPANP